MLVIVCDFYFVLFLLWNLPLHVYMFMLVIRRNQRVLIYMLTVFDIKTLVSAD